MSLPYLKRYPLHSAGCTLKAGNSGGDEEVMRGKKNF
jgi:hypothetical protein